MENESEIERAQFMLRTAAAYIRAYHQDGKMIYDDAECDGYCVADDCETAASMLTHNV